MSRGNGATPDREERDRERRQQTKEEVAAARLQGQGGNSNAPETLKYISKPEDIETPLEALGWINSKSTSTANLAPEDVDSKKWVLEYHQLLARVIRPPTYGIRGLRRCWAYDDPEAYAEPLEPDDMLEVEGFAEIGKESTTRSKEGWGTETATRDTRESIVRDDKSDSNGGGLLSRFRS